ncbi:hypothetical protein MPER_05064 [Moniliophthora perniciosa FA553]|nr:hypothetical protein MPER_05064 [Moniliophthora perniciosa FA553]
MEALADHINRKDCISALLTSKRGQSFIRFIHDEAIMRQLVYRYDWGLIVLGDTWSQAIKRAQEVGNLPSEDFAPIPWRNDPLPTFPDLDPIRYSIDTETALHIVTSNRTEESSGAGPSEGPIRRLRDFGARLAARRWLSPFSRSKTVTHNDVDDNPIPGSRIAGSPHEMIEIATHGSGGSHEGNAQHLSSHGSTRDSGPRQQMDTGIPGDSSGQGEKAGSIGTNNYGLRR